MRKRLGLCILVLFAQIGCTSESEVNAFSGEYSSLPDVRMPDAVREDKVKYLAYIHSVQLNMSAEKISEAFTKIISMCTSDSENQCTVLNSSLNKGEYSRSSVSMRLLPTGVQSMIDSASTEAEVSSISTRGEDLQDQIIDTEKRLEMLSEYRSRLVAIERQSTNDVDALIKVATELSKVQSDLEYATGEKAQLNRRVKMDILSIDISAISATVNQSPIVTSLSNFFGDFSYGISQVITALAYIIPWLFPISLFVWIGRILLRKARLKRVK